MHSIKLFSSLLFSLTVAQRGALLVYQPAYSPDLNPIETAFHLRRHHAVYVHEPFRAHMAAMQSVSRDDMCGYYRKVRCIRNVPERAEGVDEGVEQEVVGVVAAASAFQTQLLTMTED